MSASDSTEENVVPMPSASIAPFSGGGIDGGTATFEAIGSFRPRTGTMEAWNAAYVRVEDYLRAHRIHNRLHQSRLIQTILERSARRHEADPSRTPTEYATAETDALMQRWFAATLAATDDSPERTAAQGRLALLLCDGPQKWPYAFLDERTMPADFVTAMRTGAIEAGPDMSISSMVPRPIDLGPIPEAAGETIERIENWPLLRTLVLWLVFAGCLAAIFKMTR
jgi:hypothetical protein